MNESNDTSETGREVKSPSIVSKVLSNKRGNISNNQISGQKRSKRLNNTKQNQKETANRLIPQTVEAMGSLVSTINTTDDSFGQNIANEETVVSNEVPNEETIQTNGVQTEEIIQSNEVQNENTSNESQTIQLNETSNLDNVCIDLTEEDSVVETNGHESDSEIQCITPVIQNPEFCIIRDLKRNRNRRSDRSRSPNRRHQRPQQQIDDIIEIPDSQLSQTIISDSTNQTSSTPRKLIKCPVCLDEYSMFRISGKQLVSTNCGHLFCDLCIKEVIKTSKSCPSCRKKIATQKSFHPIYL